MPKYVDLGRQVYIFVVTVYFGSVFILYLRKYRDVIKLMNDPRTLAQSKNALYLIYDITRLTTATNTKQDHED